MSDEKTDARPEDQAGLANKDAQAPDPAAQASADIRQRLPLPVVDDVLRNLRKLFPELPLSFWEHSGQYLSCSVYIKDDDCDSPVQ
jgi:hypothetical protein